MAAISFDSSAVVQWVTQKQGWKAIDSLFRQIDDLYLPGPALTEVIYISRQLGNVASGEQVAATLAAQGLTFEMCTHDDHLRAAELHELSRLNPGAGSKTLSFGDALIIAVCERLGTAVVTRDKLWQQLREQGHIRIPIQTF